MSRYEIKKWMLFNADRFMESGELNLTKIVEAWDIECDSGEATVDSDHPAWEVALEVSNIK